MFERSLAGSAIAVGLTLGGCDRAPPPRPSTPVALPVTSAADTRDAGPELDAALDADAAPTADGPFNVILIVIDSLRYDVEWNGFRRIQTPRLSAFAKKAVVYRQAYSISSTTARSVAPLLVGRYPSEMVRNGLFFTQWYPDNVFIGERLQKLGVKTLALASHAYFFPASGMKQGFDDYQILPNTVLNDPDPKPSAEPLTKNAEFLLRRAADPQGKRVFFAYFHYLDPHMPYLEHEEFPAASDDPRDLYDQEVSYTDAWVGALIDWIDKQRFADKTVVIVSADHGECFGEHGQIKHGYELWEELVHVPLLIRVPGSEPRVIDTRRSHIDLARTILELMHAPADPSMRGVSLVPELKGADPGPRPIVLDLPRDDLQDRRRAIIDGEFKLIAKGDDEKFLLYNLAKDPHEKKNLTDSDPDRFERMKKRYSELSDAIELVEVRGDAKLKNAPPDRRW